jgi:hypothetical protein
VKLNVKVELGVEVLELLLVLRELVVVGVAVEVGVVVEEVSGVEVAVVEVLGGVLTGVLVGDGD